MPARIDPEEAAIGRPTPTARCLVEVSALRWADVADSAAGDGMLLTVRRSKTNPDGEVKDVRFVKDGVARALRLLRAATSPEPGDRVVPLSAQMIGLRFTAAAMVAGVESRVTAHSGRVGLASELTSRGASIFPETSLPLDLPGNEESGIEVGALIIAVDVNQLAAEFEDGSAEPGTSEVRIRFEQPLSHEAADRAMLLGRRADVRREFSRIHGSIAR